MLEQKKILTVLNEIKETEFPIGAKQLSLKLSIPQATIGRMLTDLENDGLIEKVSNKGRKISEKGVLLIEKSIIQNEKLKTAHKLINMFEDISKQKLLEILDARKLLELRTVELACKNATEADIIELDGIMYEHIYSVRNNGLGNEQDLKFHLTIAKISKNTTIYQILKLLLTEKNAYTKFAMAQDHILFSQYKFHDDILQAIKNKDPNEAKEKMEQHLNKVMSDVSTHLK
jgi:GntR family L-lactate dehydrogenase operon transcriptional regulator